MPLINCRGLSKMVSLSVRMTKRAFSHAGTNGCAHIRSAAERAFFIPRRFLGQKDMSPVRDTHRTGLKLKKITARSKRCPNQEPYSGLLTDRKVLDVLRHCQTVAKPRYDALTARSLKGKGQGCFIVALGFLYPKFSTSTQSLTI